MNFEMRILARFAAVYRRGELHFIASPNSQTKYTTPSMPPFCYFSGERAQKRGIKTSDCYTLNSFEIAVTSYVY